MYTHTDKLTNMSDDELDAMPCSERQKLYNAAQNETEEDYRPSFEGYDATYTETNGGYAFLF